MGDELKWLLKVGGGHIFENPLSRNRPTPFESRPTQVLKNPGITDFQCNNEQYSSKTVQQE